ncbi:HAD-IA family hydrolase [Longimicrobium sp.]|uniref:HAD-IA family hydrolase n=1 Tax=Longimicrobium sp. TaxID=2029185 RepID=UPI002E306CFE|nr:HAD-IA family hydrolase [Longimicrobium sp.]HEX6037772.1 HAD-IA family hydrolase [Longimicrobium sp.]
MPDPFAPDPRLKAVIFDLDNTLCATDHLNQVRLNGTREQLQPHLPRLCAYPQLDAVLAELSRVLPVAIVSRARSWYTEDVLRQIFPNVRWATVVSYDDVILQKPHPAGLLLAAERMGIADRRGVAYLGDTKDDMEAAYHAGMRPVLCTWGAGVQQGYFSKQIIPDAVLDRVEDILAYVRDPDAFLPLLEARLAKRDPPAGTRRQLTEFAGKGPPFVINVLGRYFSNAGSTLHLHAQHDLSRWLERKDEPGQFVQQRFVYAVAEAVEAIGKEADINTVTVIPSKAGAEPRMERLLAALGPLMRPYYPAVDFVPDLLAFAPDAQRIKHMKRAERLEEVERSLHLVKPVPGRRVLVLDDVLTVGGTMRTARRLLLAGGAAHVVGLALTKTIGGAMFRVDPTTRPCPACGRNLVVIPKRNGGRFRGCEGYWSEPKCRYTESI